MWHPSPVLLPGKSHGWRSLVGWSPWGRTESDTTEATPHAHSYTPYNEQSRAPALIPGACEREPNGRKDCISVIVLRVVRWRGCPEKQCDYRGPRGRETREKGLHPSCGERGAWSGGEWEGPGSPGPSAGTSPAKPLVLAPWDPLWTSNSRTVRLKCVLFGFFNICLFLFIWRCRVLVEACGI